MLIQGLDLWYDTPRDEAAGDLKAQCALETLSKLEFVNRVLQ